MTAASWCEVHVGTAGVRVVPPDGEPWVAGPVDTLTPEELARIRSARPVRIWIGPPDTHMLAIDPGARSIAKVLAEEASLRRDRLGWGVAPGGIVLAHRDRIKALSAAFDTRAIVADVDGAPVALRWEPPRRPLVLAAVLLIATVPFSTWGLATMMAREVRAQTVALAAAGTTPTPGPDVFQSPSISETVSAFAATLPSEARLHALASGPDRRVLAEVDIPDPDALRTALRRTATLAAFREVDQRPVPDGTIRVRVQGVIR